MVQAMTQELISSFFPAASPSSSTIASFDPDDKRGEQRNGAAHDGELHHRIPLRQRNDLVLLHHDLAGCAPDRDGHGAGGAHHDPLDDRLAADVDLLRHQVREEGYPLQGNLHRFSSL
jgi:hypothetical protein